MNRLFVASFLAILGFTIACSAGEPAAAEGRSCSVVAVGEKGVFTPLLAFAAALVLLRRSGGNRPNA
jgi:hypothetical protein